MERLDSTAARPVSLAPDETKRPQRGSSSCGTSWKQAPGTFLYTVVGFVLSWTGFVCLVTLLAAGISTLIIWVGIPLLLGTQFVARGFALAQCYLLRLTGLPQISVTDWGRGGATAHI